jgi:alpha-D-xyloside xylohydrolase
VKFTDGSWMMRPGVRGSYAVETRDVTITDRSLALLASTQPIRHRGDTLGGPVLTAAARAPMPDVVAVRLTHLAGGVDRPPWFQLAETDNDVSVTQDDTGVELRSGRLVLRVSTAAESWRVDFVADGRALTSAGVKDMGIVTTADGGHYMLTRLGLGVGATVHGLGERFGPFVRNGQVVDIWNADGGTNSEQAYKNVPFYVTNDGYGVFVNHPGRVSFEVASENVEAVQFSVEGHDLEFVVIYGPSPKEIVERYTALTGRPALPPAWSFGLWLSTSFTTSYDEDTVTSFIEGMERRDLPLSVFHFDCFWMREYRWCDFEWDPRTFPDPEGMLRRLGARGLRTSVWINPYVAQASPLFAEGKERRYLLRRADGSVWQWDRWQPGMGLVDFTNPEASAWYQGKLQALLEMGVECFKTDFGERVPTDVVWHDGSDPHRMHNYYTYLYNRAVFEVLEKHHGQGQAVVFARSATAGSQQFPVHWGGDNASTFESMAESLRGGLSLGLSGFGFWSHDIGGFEGTPEPAVFKRWVPFGLLSSHSRLHGNESYRVPWLIDDESVDVTRVFTKLKHRLMPYLFQVAVEAQDRGIPVMRAMLLEFPDDPTSPFLDRQYVLGDSLLVAPVFAADGEVTYYVPAGRWTHLQTGAIVDGPGWQRERHGFSSLPLLVRPGSVLAWGMSDDRPDYDYTAGVTLRAYELTDGDTVATVVPALDGRPAASFVTRCADGQVSVTADGNAPGWRVLLIGATDVADLDGGTPEVVREGVMLTPADGSRVVTGRPGR